MSVREVPADRLVAANHGVATATRQHLAPLMSSNTAEWHTPRHVLDAACTALGGRIDLDPCAEPARAVPASQHFTLAEDGLVRPWMGTVYLNPPYGRDIIKWTGKLRCDYDAGLVTAAVALLPARTDTAWWAGLRVDWLCLIRGRLSFSDHATNAPFPSAAVYLGRDGESFRTAFTPLGPVYRRVAG